MDMTRRSVVTAGGIGAVGLMGFTGLTQPFGNEVEAKSASTLARSKFPGRYRSSFQRLPVLKPDRTYVDAEGMQVEHYIVTQRRSTAALIPGFMTPVVGYNGLVPGPTILAEQGIRTRVTMRNQVTTEHDHSDHDAPGFVTSTHLHGHASLPEYDGYANDITPFGYYKDYIYDNFQRARSTWYHDHAHHFTSTNVYAGLAAQYLLHDPIERALLPQGEFDVPLTINDVIFNADGSLRYEHNDDSGMWGDVILVNGKPWPVMKVQRRVYRFRLLNASLSRSYRFRLSTGDDVTMVGTDGGLMPVSQSVQSWRHAPAERYEFLIDFRRYAPGTRVQLLNRSNPKNIDFDYTNKVMAFDVIDEPVDTTDATWNTIPQTLDPSTTMSLTEADRDKERHFRFNRDDQTNIWNINGETWKDVIESNYERALAEPDLDDVEIWDLETRSGGWFHPVHIHLIDFKILSRNGRAPYAYERGPKDVAYVGPDETVRVIMRFEHRRGRYMIHCHNLPHEDHDMMHQFIVGWKPGDPDPHHPVYAAPAVPDDTPIENT